MTKIPSVYPIHPPKNLIVSFGSSILGMTDVVSEVPLVDYSMLGCTMTTGPPWTIGLRCCPSQLA